MTADFRSLTATDFASEFGEVHTSVFSPSDLPADPFVRPWSMVLLPYGAAMEYRDFHSITAGALICGDEWMVLVDVESIRPSEAAVVFPNTYDAFERVKARPGTNLAIMDTHLFAQSGRWGCIYSASFDGVTVVGGDHEFMRTFTREIGGVTSLRARFGDFAKREWSVSEADKIRLMELVGW